MTSLFEFAPQGRSDGRPLTALTRVEQLIVWTLRHARAQPAAHGARRGEWAIAVRGFAAAAAAAGESVVAALGARPGMVPAPLAARRTSAGEEAILDALAAVHANAPARFAAACAALGVVEDGAAADSLTVFAVTIEAGGIRLAVPAGAWAQPAAAVARWIN